MSEPFPWEIDSVAYEREVASRQMVIAIGGTASVVIEVEVLAALDRMHRAYGGSGLEIADQQTVTRDDGSTVDLITMEGDAEPLALVAAELRRIIAKVYGNDA